MEEIEGIDVTTATLWIYKKHDNRKYHYTQALYITEVEDNDDDPDGDFIVKEKPLGIHTVNMEGELFVFSFKLTYRMTETAHISKNKGQIVIGLLEITNFECFQKS